MLTLNAREMDSEVLAAAVAGIVRDGAVVIFPTDTVYGIGCDPASERSVDRIYAAKSRSREKPLSLHFATVEELLEYARGNAMAERVARRFLPGPLTVIVSRPASVPAFVTGGLPTVGLRAPKHALCRAILEASGPLAATSANYSGASAFAGGGAVTNLPAADVFVDDGPTPLGAESTVIDVSGEKPRLVREGAIGAAMLEDVLGPFEGRNGR